MTHVKWQIRINQIEFRYDDSHSAQELGIALPLFYEYNLLYIFHVRFLNPFTLLVSTCFSFAVFVSVSINLMGFLAPAQRVANESHSNELNNIIVLPCWSTSGKIAWQNVDGNAYERGRERERERKETLTEYWC